jgi:hypothetical protein
MPRPKKSASALADPLFAAMIAKLPPADKAWDVDRQLAWLNMMAMAFGTVYGGNAAERLACKCHDTHQGHGAAPALPGQMLAPNPLQTAPPGKFMRNGAALNGAVDPVPDAPKPVVIPHPFYIDKEGYARNKKGDRVTAEQVSDYIADMRGEEGDLAAIIWADGAMGLPKDKQLDVTLG